MDQQGLKSLGFRSKALISLGPAVPSHGRVLAALPEKFPNLESVYGSRNEPRGHHRRDNPEPGRGKP